MKILKKSAFEPDKETLRYPDHVKSDPVLKSIFDRIHTSQPSKLNEFNQFIAP